MRLLLYFLIGCSLVTGCKRSSVPKDTPKAVQAHVIKSPSLTNEQQNQWNHIKMLASERFQGRATGHKGGIMAKEYLVNQFKEIGLTPFFKAFEQPFRFKGKSHHKLATSTTAYNIIAKVPGEVASEKVIVIGAHYDHLGVQNGQVFNGADDNASGVAALLSIAHYFMQHPPKHTLIFAAWDAEELGLQGSDYFVSQYPNINEFTLAHINLDMIGRSAKKELYVCGTSHYPALKHVITNPKDSDKITLRFGHDGQDGKDDWTLASDHGSFHQKGIPFLYFGVEDHPDYHKASDDIEHLDQSFYFKATKIILHTIRALDEHFD